MGNAFAFTGIDAVANRLLFNFGIVIQVGGWVIRGDTVVCGARDTG